MIVRERAGGAVDLDLVISNGTVVDGTGAAQFRADVGVRGGRIAAISRGERLRGRRAVDATGLAVAPGFVDLDSHVDWALVGADPGFALARWLRQGVTTAVGGACGFSPAPVRRGAEDVVASVAAFLRDGPFVPRWSTFAEFMQAVAAGGLPLNVGFLVGQNTLRAQAAGTTGTPGAEALRAMVEGTTEALRAGALGVAACVPGTAEGAAEIAALAGTVAREGGLFAVHARAYTRLSDGYPPFSRGGPHNLRAIRELLGLARRTGVRLHVFHLMVAGRRTWPTCGDVLRTLDAAAGEGVDVGFDAAPYTVSVGPIRLTFPGWFTDGFPERARGWRVRALEAMVALQRPLLGMGFDDLRLRSACDDSLRSLEGLTFAELGRRLGLHPVAAQVEVARRVGMNGASVLIGTASGDAGDDAPLRAILAHRLCVFATNAASTRTGPQNPSATGAFPRVLGRYVREQRLLSLEEAVRRMTSLPAERLGLPDVGRVAEGCWADLTLFDPGAVGDARDPERFDAEPTGIRMVLVSGEPVVEGGIVAQGVLPGRVLRRGSAPLRPASPPPSAPAAAARSDRAPGTRRAS